MFRVLPLTICLALPLAGSGCAIVEVGMRNPVVGLETVAVAPFFNLSQERTVDGREFALDYYAELQKVPGFEVLPVGVTERAMVENGISLTGPNDAVRLAQILDVDAVVVGAVTDYDAYNPRIGLKVAWYSPRQFLFLPNEDPSVPFFNRAADAPVKRPGRPKFGKMRAQSPDDESAFVEEGNWETVGSEPETGNILQAAAGDAWRQNFESELPTLPAGTSLLVPVGDDRFPSLPEPETFSKPKTAQEPVPAPPAEEVFLEEDWQPQTRPVSYQEDSTDVKAAAPESVSTDLPQPSANVGPAQGNDSEPPVTFQPPPSVQPIVPAEPAFSGSPPACLPANKSPVQKPVQKQAIPSPAGDNPFTRHLRPESSAEMGNAAETPRPGSSGSTPKLAAQQSEFSGQPGSSGESPSTKTLPPVPDASDATSQSKMAAPVMQTPVFPTPQPRLNQPGMKQWQTPAQATRPALIYDEKVVVAPNEFDSTEPLMAYVRLFDATDRRLIARLSDYLELTGQLRSEDLEAYMKRSEFFRKFTAYGMISEMLQLHGGEARRQLVLKPRKYR